MKITDEIAGHITDSFDGENWTGVNIDDTIKDVNWQQAQQRTAASQNTIASLLHHLYYWNGILLQRAEGINPAVPESNGYDVQEFKNEKDWNELKEKARQSFIQLADVVRNFPEEKLFDTSPTG